jgi:peptidoglycan/LPS O-acetylase OafA/YrhL
LHSTQNIYSAPLGQEDVLPGLVNRLTPAVFLGNLLFLQGILTQTFGTNASLWSLSYEFWYYIFFPLLVIVVLPSKAISQRVFAAVLLLTAASLCGREISSYFLLWLFGVVVALLPLRLPSNRTRLTIFAGSATFIATMFVMLKYRVDLYLSDVVLATTFSFLLWSILHATGVTVSSLYRSAAQGLSNMSYTLYLVHLPCFALISAILMPTWQGWTVSQNSLLATLAIYAAVFGIAVLMYGCFERNTDRIRHRLSGLISTRKRPTDSPRPPQMVAIRSAN